MESLFAFEDVLEVVSIRAQELGANPTEAQRTVYKFSKKKD